MQIQRDVRLLYQLGIEWHPIPTATHL
uniref:Uncharacterized protein n=1 Tax=Lepeophtheirus salmonis TaxID=72036 RepID=A0A0K2VJB3_LEPSM